MESADGQRGKEAGQRRSPFDLIMNQIRRKRPGSDRKSSGRFLSRLSSEGGMIPEDRDKEEKERGEGTGVIPDPADSPESVYARGWGRVCVFVQRLGKRADSRILSLSHCDLTATDILELATLLQCLSQLEEMDLSWNELIGGSLRALTSHLQNVGGLITLRLCSCRLNADDISALGDALEYVPLLEVMDLSWNLDAGGGSLLGLSGKLPPSLRELHLVACQLTSADTTALGGMASGLTKLCVLDVSCNPLLVEGGDAGVMGGLASFLSHTPSLTTLRLHACGLTPNTLEILGDSFHYLPSLRELDLSSNKHLAGGLSLLTPHLVCLTHLESLDLHLCHLTNTDLGSLIQVLSSLSELTELDVSSNKAVGTEVHSLVSALPLVQMRRLPLNSCCLNEDSFTALALAIPLLRIVDVSWCKVVGGRLALLLDALQPSFIQELRLSSCDLTTNDLHQLGAVCKRGCLSSLCVLDLSYNGEVKDEGWSALFGAGGLGLLEDLDLSLRPLTSAPSEAWLPSLLSALPRLSALARLGMQRWTLTTRGRDQLNHTLRKKSVQLEWDPPTSSSTNKDVPDKMHTEE